MNHYHRLGFFGKVPFDKPFIDIQGVFPYIYKVGRALCRMKALAVDTKV